MANIDVSHVLDGDFCDPVTVTRWIETVGDDGRATYVEEVHEIFASIQAEGSDLLEMNADSSRANGKYEIITTFPLAITTDTVTGDTVMWGGKEFVVTSIDRFGNFATGAGHYEGIMERLSLTSHTGAP